METGQCLPFAERNLIQIQKGMMIGTRWGNCGNPLVDTMDDDEHLGAVDLFCLLEDNIFNTAGDRQYIRGVQVREDDNIHVIVWIVGKVIVKPR